MRSTIVFFLLLSVFVVSAQQQMGTYMAYGPEAKYFSNLNYAVYQTQNGYLWIGTQNGLVRFDGRRYKNYFSNYADPNSPADNNICDITEDKNGDLWFAGFYNGVTKYNQRTGLFKKYPVLSKDNNPYYGIYSLMKDKDGDLWFGTAGRGLAKYIYEKDSFRLFYPEPGKAKDGLVRGDNFVTDMVEDKWDKNILWCSSFHGLFSFNKQTGSFTHYPGDHKPEDSTGVLFNSLECDAKGDFWLGSWGGGLYFFNGKTRSFETKRAKRKPDIVYDLKSVNDSFIYAACLNYGLYRLNINTGEFINITPPRNPADPTSQNPDIQKVSVTPGAGIFIGGNYYVYQQHPDFVRLKKNVTYPDVDKRSGGILLNNCVWDEKRKRYWLATTGGNGLYSLSGDLKKITTTSFKLDEPGTGHAFHDLVVDATSRVWVLSKYNTLLEWNDREEIFEKPTIPLPMPDAWVKRTWKLKQGKDGNIWMMSGNNFIYRDISSNKTEIYPIAWDTAYKGPHDVGNSELQVDPGGDAWLLTQSGMFHCRRKEKKVDHIFHTGTGETDLSSQVILTGGFNKYDDFWITSGNSIQVFNYKKYFVLSNHNSGGGLPSMNIRGIVVDTSGKVWAGTSAGLALFDPTKKTWQLFNRFDGLERDFLDISLLGTSNNKIVIDQLNGFVIKDLDELLPDTQPPVLRITSLFINSKEYIDSLLPEFIDKLVLPYDRNNINIEFAAMDWLYPFKTSYLYKIEGIPPESTWAPIPDCKINLTGLPTGKYIVHIRAISGNDIWSKEIVFPIIIRPPYWKTAWFIALCILGMGVILYSIYRYRINQLQRMQEMRNNISRNLHDDIGASLSNINILNELAKRNIERHDDKAKGYLSQVGEDIQRISEGLGDIVWNINPRYDDINNLFVRMKRYAADMMEGKEIAFGFNFPPEHLSLTLPMDKRRDFYLIFKEAINNLVKYSKATEACVEVKTEAGRLFLLVKDNGVGFDKTRITEGNGLYNMKQRAAQLKAALTINSEPGSGTTVKLEMKI